MTNLRTAAQQALEALEHHGGNLPWNAFVEVRKDLRAALAQEQAEPVAWLQPKTMDAHLRPDLGYETCSSADYGAFPVYRAPPKRKPLTEEEIVEAVREADLDWQAGWTLDEHAPNRFATLARAIERAHGIGETK